jgi:hypothetical protein
VPAADDLFRPTGSDEQVVELPSAKTSAAGKQSGVGTAAPSGRTASGRVKHDEKMTVYVTADELLDIEHARLELRRHHGLAVDRGRLVRAAVAMALADLDEQGADSALVRRLSAG